MPAHSKGKRPHQVATYLDAGELERLRSSLPPGESAAEHLRRLVLTSLEEGELSAADHLRLVRTHLRAAEAILKIAG